MPRVAADGSGDGRLRRSLRLTGIAASVVRRDPSILALAGLSALSSLAVVGLSIWLFSTVSRMHFVLVAVALSYPALTSAAFFNVATAVAAAAALDGAHATTRQAIGVAWSRLPQILGWSLLAWGVGLIIDRTVRRIPGGGGLVVLLAGASWSVASLLVVPILAVEGARPVASLRRSATLVRGCWGEGVAGSVAITAWSVLCMIPAGLLLVAGIVAAASPAGIVTIVAAVAALLATASLAGAVQGTFQVALYRFAVDGVTPAPFATDDLARPFSRRRSSSP